MNTYEGKVSLLSRERLLSGNKAGGGGASLAQQSKRERVGRRTLVSVSF